MRLLITRSEPGASRMADELASAGVASLVCPLIQAVPTGQPMPKLLASEAKGSGAGNCFDHVIFVSEHAVAFGLEVVQQMGSGAQWYAIGPATASVLRTAMARYRHSGAELVNVPEPARTEGLLADQRLQLLEDQQVLLVAGEDGRTLLAETLSARGALVAQWLTYRRNALPADTLAKVLLGSGAGSGDGQPGRLELPTIDGCVASSGQGLELLTHQWLGAGGGFDLPVCVPSPRVAAMARRLGWQKPVLCAGASAQATLAGLKSSGYCAGL